MIQHCKILAGSQNTKRERERAFSPQRATLLRFGARVLGSFKLECRQACCCKIRTTVPLPPDLCCLPHFHSTLPAGFSTWSKSVGNRWPSGRRKYEDRVAQAKNQEQTTCRPCFGAMDANVQMFIDFTGAPADQALSCADFSNSNQYLLQAMHLGCHVLGNDGGQRWKRCGNLHVQPRRPQVCNSSD